MITFKEIKKINKRMYNIYKCKSECIFDPMESVIMTSEDEKSRWYLEENECINNEGQKINEDEFTGKEDFIIKCIKKTEKQEGKINLNEYEIIVPAIEIKVYGGKNNKITITHFDLIPKMTKDTYEGDEDAGLNLIHRNQMAVPVHVILWMKTKDKNNIVKKKRCRDMIVIKPKNESSVEFEIDFKNFQKVEEFKGVRDGEGLEGIIIVRDIFNPREGTYFFTAQAPNGYVEYSKDFMHKFWAQTIGFSAVCNKQWGQKPRIMNHPVFGSSKLGQLPIIGILVDNYKRHNSIIDMNQKSDDEEPRKNVGNIVKERLFGGSKDFLFNVCFVVGDYMNSQSGDYGNPNSHWFNVFFGYYEIVVSKSDWNRPFGYTKDKKIDFDEVSRLGMADWNFFSNWMYGVPIEKINQVLRPCKIIDKNQFYDGDTMNLDKKLEILSRHSGNTICTHLGTVDATGSGKYWDLIELDNVDVVSIYLPPPPPSHDYKYESKFRTLEDRAYFKENLKYNCGKVLTNTWRGTYGLPNPKLNYGEDSKFMSTNMSAKIYMSYYETPETYRTLFFGGTANNSWIPYDNISFEVDEKNNSIIARILDNKKNEFIRQEIKFEEYLKRIKDKDINDAYNRLKSFYTVTGHNYFRENKNSIKLLLYPLIINFNNKFLDEQIRSCSNVIKDKYNDFGFDNKDRSHQIKSDIKP